MLGRTNRQRPYRLYLPFHEQPLVERHWIYATNKLRPMTLVLEGRLQRFEEAIQRQHLPLSTTSPERPEPTTEPTTPDHSLPLYQRNASRLLIESSSITRPFLKNSTISRPGPSARLLDGEREKHRHHRGGRCDSTSSDERRK